MVNWDDEATDHSIGASNVSEPPHGADPVEHLHAGRDRDQHGGEHEVDLAAQRHALMNMWWAQTMNDRNAIAAVAYTIAW